jgi:hypothetical protein
MVLVVVVVDVMCVGVCVGWWPRAGGGEGCTSASTGRTMNTKQGVGYGVIGGYEDGEGKGE